MYSTFDVNLISPHQKKGPMASGRLGIWNPGPVFSYKLRYIVGLGLVEMAISTNPKPTIYRNLYGNTGPDHIKGKR